MLIQRILDNRRFNGIKMMDTISIAANDSSKLRLKINELIKKVITQVATVIP